MALPRTAIVTGAGSGIGREVALQLASLGYALTLAGRTRATLDETRARCEAQSAGARAECVVADMAVAREAGALAAACAEAHGGLGVVVNCAAVASLRPIERTDDELIERTFRANTFGPMALIRSAWPIFVQQGGGCIVNVSTYGTLDPFPGFLAYAASKSALDSVTRSCHNEGASKGIRAFTINPGAVETGMLRSMFPTSALPTSRTLDPADVARVIVDCIEGRRDNDRGRTIPLTRA